MNDLEIRARRRVCSAPSWTACAGRDPGLWWTCRLLVLALPLIAQNLFGYGVSLISLLVVGRLGTYQLSVAVLASSSLNITGLAFMIGLTSAMETLCGQVGVHHRGSGHARWRHCAAT